MTFTPKPSLQQLIIPCSALGIIGALIGASLVGHLAKGSGDEPVAYFIGASIGGIILGRVGYRRAQRIASSSYQEALARRAEVEKRQREKLDNEEKERQRILKEKERAMLTWLKKIQLQYEDLLKLLPQAERHLNQAEIEYSERVFAPFWDQIEHATNNLAAYHKLVKELDADAQAYAEAIRNLPSKLPTSKAVIGRLIDHESCSTRLYQIVRRAQSDHQFAEIFELRKTNKLLVEGFRTLEAALYSVGDSVTNAVDSLSEVVGQELRALNEQVGYQTETLSNLSEEHRTFFTELQHLDFQHREGQNAQLWSRLDEQNRMLDNIQRRRRP